MTEGQCKALRKLGVTATLAVEKSTVVRDALEQLVVEQRLGTAPSVAAFIAMLDAELVKLTTLLHDVEHVVRALLEGDR